jgi:hypothetical protein
MKRIVCAGLLVLSALPHSTVSADPPCGSTPGLIPRLFHKPVPMPAPLGTYVNGWYEAQAVAAEADQFVIYRQEWYLDGIKPGPYGGYHLQRIGQRLPSVPFQVIIEVDLRDEKINVLRQTYVVNQLLAAGVKDAQARVVIGYPRAEGLYGDEGARIFLQRYSGSQGGVGGTTGGSSLGGGGLGIGGGGAMGGSRGY